MRAFAQREGRPYEDIKKRMAQLHCQSLFESGNADNEANQIDVLRSISQQLEYLQTICGLQSFYLAVNPGDPSDQGFLGGTLLGREFWRGYRGCGEPGARAFREYCTNASATPTAVPWASTSAREPTPQPAAAPGVQPAGGAALRKSPANALKAEVYLAVRTAVRAASGVRTAEMKWSNHANLAAYGVELRGWPPDVPVRNPSLLSAAQNQAVLDALHSGAMRFRRIGQEDAPAPDTLQGPRDDDAEVDALFEDTIDFDASSGDDARELGKRKREE
ncbi:hypothetical protein PsYK624_047250 [Phanerochaete sordida]|uniref:Uncharacterized protein n=1 Tax=Phanerochaete sordida TaxID=48140 RepID=A0A9P3G3W1_9APHY|nr:hypothetical protein PsYK624_047250 [Phanerochaete sordida]